jgi:cytochrome c oxidase cbb3-type subunit 1
VQDARSVVVATTPLFFLTAGFLAIMYFVPKRADRPVYSYRSIIHFWALISYMAGPHHLHYTRARLGTDARQTFSIMLWMPSWGRMTGLMISGAWTAAYRSVCG